MAYEIEVEYTCTFTASFVVEDYEDDEQILEKADNRMHEECCYVSELDPVASHILK